MYLRVQRQTGDFDHIYGQVLWRPKVRVPYVHENISVHEPELPCNSNKWTDIGANKSPRLAYPVGQNAFRDTTAPGPGGSMRRGGSIERTLAVLVLIRKKLWR